MVRIAAETKKGTVRRRVCVTAPTIERALELASGEVLSYLIISRCDEGMDPYEKAA